MHGIDAASELTPGHWVHRSGADVPPIVLASPHSGRAYPPAFLAEAALGRDELRCAEDAYVDLLMQPAADALGLPLITARWARTFIDLNRDPGELDPALFEDAPLGTAGERSERVRAGLGILPRVAVPGTRIYRRRLARAEAERRIELVHAPYHQRLAALIAAAQAVHGYALLVDCHSMPSLSLRQRRAPQIVVGDRFGDSADAALVARIEHHLGTRYRVVRNQPYAGGYTTKRYGAPARGIHAVQIEIDRALYMAPATLQRHEGFAHVAADLKTMLADLADWLPRRFGAAPPRLAAE